MAITAHIFQSTSSEAEGTRSRAPDHGGCENRRAAHDFVSWFEVMLSDCSNSHEIRWLPRHAANCKGRVFTSPCSLRPNRDCRTHNKLADSNPTPPNLQGKGSTKYFCRQTVGRCAA